jgi:hypothetical protein
VPTVILDLLRLYHDASLVILYSLVHQPPHSLLYCFLVFKNFTFVLQELNELLRNNKLELDDAGAVMVPEVNILSYLPLYSKVSTQIFSHGTIDYLFFFWWGWVGMLKYYIFALLSKLLQYK